MDLQASAEVAKRFGLSVQSLGTYLSRHPHLRPKRRAGTSFLWTPEDIERLAEHRMRPISRGKKKKQ